MKFSAPRGTHDLWAQDAARLNNLELIAREVFERYNFSEIKFPAFEDAGLFTRSIGEATDIVEKEMYVFEDRKGRKLALRPEGTASVVRSLVEIQLLQKLPVSKLFYCGSMFRYERPQAGRYREFYQIGAEYFGNAGPSADAEVIILNKEILSRAGIANFNIHINSLGCRECRPVFRKSLTEYFGEAGKSADLCSDCQRRIDKNPLRVLDCKVDGHKFGGVPKMYDSLCPSCLEHFKRVRGLLDAAGCGYEIDHKLVRGLDYYTRTIFEIRSSALGAQDAISAGGRYDNLVEELGGAKTPAVGFALGSERVITAATASSKNLEPGAPEKIFVAVSSPVLENEAFSVAAALRGLSPQGVIEGRFADKSLKSQFKLADRFGAGKVVIVGEEEFRRGCLTVRDMATKQQSEAG